MTINLNSAVESTTRAYCTDSSGFFADFLSHRMGDTPSIKNQRKSLKNQHISPSRYDSTAEFRIKNYMKIGVFSCYLLIMPLVAKASPPSWQIEPAASQLTFTATQNGAPVSGEFKNFAGTILFDPNDLKNSSIDIVVDINSINASYAEIKTTLMTSDWFNVKLFPKAEFKSTQIDKTGEKAYQAKGTLTIRDKAEPVVLMFTLEQPNPNKSNVVGNTVIKRTQFGVGQGEWAGTNQIKDDVTINFKVVADKK